MKILFCNYEYPPLGGGGGVATSFIAHELAKRHEVTVLTSQLRGLPSKQATDRVQIIRVPVIFRKEKTVANLLSLMTFIPLAIRTGKKLLENSNYDLINTHFALPTGPVGDTLARHAKIPNVLSLHGGDVYDPSKLFSPHRNPLLQAWIRRLLRKADRVVVNSNDTLHNMRRYYLDDIDVTRIELGIRGHDVGTALRGKYGCKSEEALLVTVGRLIARKAIYQLITMMASLNEENVRLLILGKGPQEKFLIKTRNRKGLENKIIFLGHVDENEKFRILKMCDIYVSTSQHEGFGLAFLEAMQSGLPIVCYDNGGQNDFLKDQETGYLVQLNDINQFTKKCEILVRNPMLREEIGEYNRLKAQDFHIDRCAAMYEDVFIKTLLTFRDNKRYNVGAKEMSHDFKNKDYE
jgi:glycosyltransferase involved in cell wall biosynthesis